MIDLRLKMKNISNELSNIKIILNKVRRNSKEREEIVAKLVQETCELIEFL